MPDFSDVLDAGDNFTQVTFHMLIRQGETIFIFVHKILSGDGAGKFFAHPSLLVGGFNKEQAGYGDSADEALHNCLQRVKGIPPHKMNDSFEKLKRAGLI